MRLSPFSFVILVLVGRGGAGPHDLRRMAEDGRVYWDAAPSQWYAEPKRLEAHGYLAVLEGLEAMRPDLEAALAGVEAGQARAAELTHRAHLLQVNHRYARKVLELQREWLEEAELVLQRQR